MLALLLIPLLAAKPDGGSRTVVPEACQREVTIFPALHPELEQSSPCMLFFQHPAPTDALSVLQQQLHLTPEVAKDVLALETAAAKARRSWDAFPAQSKEVARMSEQLLAQHPEDEVARGIFLANHSERPQHLTALTAALDKKDGVAFAMKILQHPVSSDERPDWDHGLIDYVASRAPDRATELIRLNSPMFPETKLAILDAALAHPERVPNDELLRHSRNTLISLLSKGYFAYAVSTFKRLPKTVQTRLISGDEPPPLPKRKSMYGMESGDIRLPLAMAMITTGDLQTARELRSHANSDVDAGTSSQPGTYDDFGGECGQSLGRAIVDWHLGTARPADTFDAMERYLSCRSNGVPAQLLIPIAGDRYGAILQKRVAWSLRDPEPSHGDEEADGGDHPFATYERALESADAQELATLRAAFHWNPDGGSSDSEAEQDDAGAGAGSSLAVWTEKKLPGDIKAYECKRGDCSGQRRDKEMPLPEGFWPVRTERAGSKTISIALSQKVDPTGEVSGGGYWLFISEDGKSWRPGIYTGLQHLRPYVVTAKSALPMLSKDGKRVSLEVNIRQIDEKHIMFPPVALSTTREATGLFVEADLSVVQRDRDGDGLTDILEERLLLDPRKKDTDGDDIPDGSDAMPNVKAQKTRTVDAALLQAFFERGKKGMAPIMTGALDRKGDKPLPMSGLKLNPQDGVTYLSAGNLDLRGLDAPERLIVLTNEQLSAAVKKFGKFYPMRFDVVLRSADGNKVFIEWSEGWRGGSIHGELRDGKWELKDLGEWVT